MENNIPGIPEPCQKTGQEMLAELDRVVSAVPKPKARPHNHKKITALEKELAYIRGNRVYRVLAWLRILPSGKEVIK